MKAYNTIKKITLAVLCLGFLDVQNIAADDTTYNVEQSPIEQTVQYETIKEIIGEFYDMNPLFEFHFTNELGIDISSKLYTDTLIFYKIGDFENIVNYINNNHINMLYLQFSPINTFADFEDVSVHYMSERKKYTGGFSYLVHGDMKTEYHDKYYTFSARGVCRWESNTGKIISCPSDFPIKVVWEGVISPDVIEDNSYITISGNYVNMYWDSVYNMRIFYWILDDQYEVLAPSQNITYSYRW